ncbi:PREDICTED: ankyrin-3-like [Ceratosolen solmsi marchali]|uniref:Ankyrin-3-like n=1 Tax=Ceratosolen solmsi marchali TaxID=326594 RepID=A0AAJ6YSU2_9HYME|nr:PREDICTED: ankyrin-3-like [Ceratosolen solmsi marchali]
MLFSSKQLSLCLYTAMMNNFLEIAKLLIRYGANVSERLPIQSSRLDNKYQVPYLHMALKCKDKDLIKLLLDHGANVNDVNNTGENSLHLALHTHDLTILELLLEKSCDLQAISTWGVTILNTAILRGNINAVSMILKAGADIKAQHHTGLTPMHFAAMSDVDNTNIAELLLARGVPVDDGDKDLVKPLHLALEYNNKRMMYFLVKHGANINSKTESSLFPLYLAVQFNHSSTVEFLLDKGAKINEVAEKYRLFSALHIACMMESEEKINVLLEYGADINIGSSNKTAFSMIENKCTRSAHIMIKHMVKMNDQHLMVNEKDMQSICKSKNLKLFYEQCCNEIIRMKYYKVYNNISYYYVLICHKKKLIPLARNLNFTKAFQFRDKLKMFPIYAAEMKVKFRRAEIMNKASQLILSEVFRTKSQAKLLK